MPNDTGVIRSVEFYNIELAPLADGRVYVSMLATTVDDQEPQLLTQEIARDTVATIEDALAVIRQAIEKVESEGLSRPLAIPPPTRGRSRPPAAPNEPRACRRGSHSVPLLAPPILRPMHDRHDTHLSPVVVDGVHDDVWKLDQLTRSRDETGPSDVRQIVRFK